MKTRSAAAPSGKYTRRRLRGRQGRAGRPRVAGRRRSGARRSSCGRCARSWARSCAATPTSARRSTPAATRSRRRSTTGCSGSSRSGSTPRRSSPTPRTPTRCSRTAASPAASGRWIKGLRGHNIHNARRRRHRLPDGRGARLRRLRVVHGEGQQEVPAAVRRPGRRLAPARIVDQAARLPRRHRRPHDDGRDDVHGRRDRTSPRPARRRCTRPRPTASSAAPSGCAARSSSRSTSRRSRPALINGLDHQFERMQDFGLRSRAGTSPVVPR